MKVKNIIAAVLAAIMLTGCAANEPHASDSSSSESSSSSVVSESGSNSSSEKSSSASSESNSSASSAESSGSAKESAPNSSSKNSASISSTENSVPESSSSSENSTPDTPSGTTPFDKHGILSVKGSDLVDKNGEKFQLRGMSTHGLAWFPAYVNYDTFKFLRDDWNTNCVRLALYTHENGGYCSGGDKAALKALVKNGVEYAKSLGMYVIVDWHVLNERTPHAYKDEAKRFFEEMSRDFADYGNVIYEICNEPNSGPSWNDVKSYANEIIPIIRANDPDSVILVGSPTWSQDIDQAAASPLEFKNVMYTLHFYATTHTDWLRNKMETCIKSGLPVFVSEFGICDASGNGWVDINSANQWKDLIERYNVSYMCWNLANKNESSSVIQSWCNKLYGWTNDELSEQGKWISQWFKSETD